MIKVLLSHRFLTEIVCCGVSSRCVVALVAAFAAVVAVVAAVVVTAAVCFLPLLSCCSSLSHYSPCPDSFRQDGRSSADSMQIRFLHWLLISVALLLLLLLSLLIVVVAVVVDTIAILAVDLCCGFCG